MTNIQPDRDSNLVPSKFEVPVDTNQPPGAGHDIKYIASCRIVSYFYRQMLKYPALAAEVGLHAYNGRK